MPFPLLKLRLTNRTLDSTTPCLLNSPDSTGKTEVGLTQGVNKTNSTDLRLETITLFNLLYGGYYQKNNLFSEKPSQEKAGRAERKKAIKV